MPSSDFLREATARGFVHQCTDTEALDAALKAGVVVRLYRLRLHRRQPACRQPGADHDPAPAAEARPPPGRADGRRHHADRRPVRQGRVPPVADRRADRRQHGRHPPLLRPVPALRRRPEPTRSCRTTPTGSSALGYIPLLREVGVALHHQPHADLRFGEAAAGARAAADLPRIQLHDPAELRLPRAVPPLRRDAADGRLRPVGQHRRGSGTGAPHRRQRRCSA